MPKHITKNINRYLALKMIKSSSYFLYCYIDKTAENSVYICIYSMHVCLALTCAWHEMLNLKNEAFTNKQQKPKQCNIYIYLYIYTHRQTDRQTDSVTRKASHSSSRFVLSFTDSSALLDIREVKVIKVKLFKSLSHCLWWKLKLLKAVLEQNQNSQNHKESPVINEL